jgi:hypothetical protein
VGDLVPQILHRTTCTKKYFTYHVSRITYHASHITHHISRITYHASRITRHSSPRHNFEGTPQHLDTAIGVAELREAAVGQLAVNNDRP